MKHPAITLLQTLLNNKEIVLDGKKFTLERFDEDNKPVMCCTILGKTEEIKIPDSIPLEYLIEYAEKLTQDEIFILNAEIVLQDIVRRK